MSQAEKHVGTNLGPYAIASDFCRIFAQEVDSLYQLSYLLTGDHKIAEECFVSALTDCAQANRVFKDFVPSWARRSIVRNAIRAIQPAPVSKRELLSGWATTNQSGMSERLAGIFGLALFDRFVFVLSVLEGYSDQDCKLLLGCSRADVIRARVRAVAQTARASAADLPPARPEREQVFAQAG